MFSIPMIFAGTFICGVLLSVHTSLTSLFFITASLLICYSVIFGLTKKFSFVAFLAIIVCFLGGLRLYFASENRLYYEFPEKYITVTGTIESTPVKTSGKHKYRYVLHTDSAEYLGKKYSVNTKIFLKYDQDINYGKYVSASGFLSKINGAENEFEYDFSRYCKSIGISNRITALELNVLGESKKYSLSLLTGKLKAHMKNKINEYFSDNDYSLLCAVILGDKTEFSPEYKTLALKTGILHTVYSPFIHISLIMLLANVLSRHEKKRYDFFSMLFFSIYAVCNSSSPGIIKASFLSLLLIFSRQLFGYSDKIKALSLIVLVMTVIEPNLCFNSGFMMSAAATFVSVTSSSRVYEMLSPGLKKIKVPSRIIQIITLWFVLCIGTIPFSAYYFNGISVYSLLFSIFITPIIAVILLLSPFIIFLPSGVSAPIICVLKLCSSILFKLPYIISRLPVYYIMLRTPSLLEFIIFYLMWAYFIRIKTKDYTQKIIAVSLAAFVICDLTGKGFNSMDVYFVNVGQGDGAVIHTVYGETVLIDGGGSADYNNDYNIGEEVYLPYLISHGFTRIDTAILSHYHKDHAEGIIAAAENLKINTLIIPPATPDNTYRKQLEEIAERRNIKIEYLKESDEIHFRSGLTLKIIAPNDTQLSGTDENDMSLVISAEYGKFTALFTGDSSTPLTADYPKNISLLKVAHHGSASSTSQKFVDYTQPKYAVISVGKDNSYNLPNLDVVERLINSGARVLQTDKKGDIRFRVNKKGKIFYSSFIGG